MSIKILRYGTFQAGCLLIMSLIFSCKKLVEVPAPITGVASENVFSNDQTATAVLNGVYTSMSAAEISPGNIKGTILVSGLSSGELRVIGASQDLGPYETASLLSTNDPLTAYWANLYAIIYKANDAIEGLNKSTELSNSVKTQLLGEAKFLRAFCYFNVVNFYGDVPLALTTDYKVNAVLSRTKTDVIYDQIIQDLLEAKTLLNSEYLGSDLHTVSSERVRPNKFTAAALLARVYLYTKDYLNAEKEASSLIDGNSLYGLEDIDKTFQIESKETIWSLYSIGAGTQSNTAEGRFFILSNTGPTSGRVCLTQELYDSFEIGDQRKVEWINTVNEGTTLYPYAFKYKIGSISAPYTEYSVVFRLGEQLLIRAESRIMQGRVSEGVTDLNRLRARARNTDLSRPQLGAISLTLGNQAALQAVESERRHELFTEGHYWFDLKRMAGFNSAGISRAEEILPASKGSNWSKDDLLYPIPQVEIDKNPSLRGHQNQGY